MIKHHDRKQLGKKGLFQLILSHHSPPSKEVRVGPQGRNPETEGNAEAMEEEPTVPHDLLTLLSYRIQPGVKSPIVGWTSHININNQ